MALLWINIKQIRSIELIEPDVIEVTYEDRTAETFDGTDAELVLKMVNNFFTPIMN